MLNVCKAHVTEAIAVLGARESGQTLLEYVLILAFLSVLLITALAALGVGIRDLLGPISSQL